MTALPSPLLITTTTTTSTFHDHILRERDEETSLVDQSRVAASGENSQTIARADDNSIPPNSAMLEWVKNLNEAAETFGKVMNVAPLIKGHVEDVGFTNVQEVIKKVCDPLLYHAVLYDLVLYELVLHNSVLRNSVLHV